MTTAEPKTVALLGVPFHDVTIEETLSAIDAVVQARQPRYIATANLDFAAQASLDVELQRILLDAHLVLCDGTPLVWASHWLKAPLRERVAGSDLTPRLCEHAAQRGYRLFFLGSDDAVLTAAKERLEASYPRIQICGTFAPPYARLLDFDHATIAARIKAAKPDILLVALGAPKQEKWIYMHHRELGVPCSIGIGASLDFVAGKFSRAPVWMRQAGLEWLYRLLQEPRRLFGRYAFDFRFFLRALREQQRNMRVRTVAEPAPAPVPIATAAPVLVVHHWSSRVDATGVASGEISEPMPDERGHLVLDTSEVTFMDSTGLGLLLKSFKRAKSAGGGLVLLRPSEAVRQLLVAMKLDRLIPIAATENQARQLLHLEPSATAPADFQPESEALICRWVGELDVVKADEFTRLVQSQWAQNSNARRLELDLAEVDFMDSTGLGCLLRARKLVQARAGAQLHVVGASANVRNVIRLAKMEQLLGVA